ncbi:hypothetical protein MNEG_4222 [Monoraphidium neglectum]|uniref:Uncharacterized protein n=1 Tax=Monoraphidium neglectum TaxID=145388 RepID=A0A0D2MLJ0_9CHLO|nr:hypothetical protein MNEG_4222 [Monoraphidium neglectum]KIZ03740.1 hypothetical protein MNEG_4222 [Monoraphidium neglectum]|eukprot:XP_013902759.1 hypothetical protein MNEG_4222 [Monoraphidium neglectum]
MWQRRIKAVAAQVQHWRGVDLTYEGRVRVAKQVLAATLVHTATYAAPPAAQLRSLQRLIDCFVAFGAADDGDPTRPLRARPGSAGGVA